MWPTILYYSLWAVTLGAPFIICMVLCRISKPRFSSFGDFGNGLIGISTLAALLAAAWIYLLGGENKARIGVGAVATVVPLAPDEAGKARVLLQFVGTVTNRGAFAESFACVGVDARAFRASGALPRNRVFPTDVHSLPLLRETAGGPQWEQCMSAERDRWQANERGRIESLGSGQPRPFIRTDSGHRYDPFDLDPGGSRTKDLEVVVPCDFAAIRINFIVPEPGGDAVQEAKTVISLTEACRASRQIGETGQRPQVPAPQTRIEFGPTRSATE